MYCCNEFNSLSVLSLNEGELIGKVDKIYIDKKLKRIIEIELIGDNDVKLILPVKNIYKIGKHAIIIKSKQAVAIKIDIQDLCLCPINSKAYSINGQYLGVIKEINFNQKYITQNIILDNGRTIEIEKVASCGKNTVIFNMERNGYIKRKQPVKNEVKEEQISQENLDLANMNVVKEENINSNFLLGRICRQDIFNFNNELLIKANSKVNKKTLKEIKRYGKLRELMLFCK